MKPRSYQYDNIQRSKNLKWMKLFLAMYDNFLYAHLRLRGWLSTSIVSWCLGGLGWLRGTCAGEGTRPSWSEEEPIGPRWWAGLPDSVCRLSRSRIWYEEDVHAGSECGRCGSGEDDPRSNRLPNGLKVQKCKFYIFFVRILDLTCKMLCLISLDDAARPNIYDINYMEK